VGAVFNRSHYDMEGHMRLRSIASAGVAVVSAAVLTLPAVARPMLTHEVNVTFTKSGCAWQFGSVSRANTRIVFHLINNSPAPAGIVIYGVKSRFATANGGEATLTVKFRGPGAYKYRCVHGNYKHPTLVRAGTFTIRNK
jgi:hypothetical protein